MKNTLETSIIDTIAPSLPLFSEQTNAFRFLCPHCQTSGKDSKGKPLAPSAAKGFLYQIGNAWNFKCQKCKECHSFSKFLEIFYPLLHFEYVRLRDQLGTTGFQTNCASFETLLKKQGMLGFDPIVFEEKKAQRAQEQHQHRPEMPPALSTAPTAPKVTKLPPMRSPQQQAGQQSRLNHLVKQREQRRRERQGW